MVIIAAIGLVGCGSKTKEEPENKSDNTADTAASAAVETKFGNIEITDKPKRIVALGWGMQKPL